MRNGFSQEARANGVQPGIHLFDASLSRGTVAVFDDPLDPAGGVSHDAAVAARIAQRGSDKTEVGPGSIRLLDQIPEQRSRDQRAVAVEHQYAPFDRSVRFHRATDSVPRAPLFGLEHHLHAFTESVGEHPLDVVATVTYDHEAARRTCVEGCLHHPAEQRSSGNLVQDLGSRAFHSRPLAGCEDDRAPGRC